jgi:hypothetical protein
MLNSAQGGATGGTRSQYSNDLILKIAKNYSTRNAWFEAAPYLVILAKARGIFEQCISHMPKRAPYKKGWKMSEEAKEAIAASKRGKSLSIKWRDKISLAHLGIKASLITRRKMSQSQKQRFSV